MSHEESEAITSRQRVATLVEGRLPDRPPTYDTLRNDAIIEHFGGAALGPDTVPGVVIAAHTAALDATKGFFKSPHLGPDDHIVTDDGRRVSRYRWTNWDQPVVYDSPAEYERIKGEAIGEPWDWTAAEQRQLEAERGEWLALQSASGDISRDWHYGGPPSRPHLHRDWAGGVQLSVGGLAANHPPADRVPLGEAAAGHRCPAAARRGADRQRGVRHGIQDRHDLLA